MRGWAQKLAMDERQRGELEAAQEVTQRHKATMKFHKAMDHTKRERQLQEENEAQEERFLGLVLTRDIGAGAVQRHRAETREQAGAVTPTLLPWAEPATLPPAAFRQLSIANGVCNRHHLLQTVCQPPPAALLTPV